MIGVFSYQIEIITLLFKYTGCFVDVYEEKEINSKILIDCDAIGWTI